MPETHNVISGGFFAKVIQARDIGSVTLQLPAQVPEALSGLPGGSASFAGRGEDLERLLDALTVDGAAVTAVSGMGGIGKTELAIQAARAALARGWFPGGVLFVDMFGYDADPARRLDVGQALEGFLRAIGVPGQHVPPAVQDRARLWQTLLKAYAERGRPILVVVDNISTREQAELALPAHPDCRAVLTSRHTMGRLGARLLDLDTLPIPAAVDVLAGAIGVARAGDTRVADHPEDACRVAEACGGLPLALQIVAALLADNPRRPLAAMAADLADRDRRLIELSYDSDAVAAAFDLSYAQLPAEHACLFRLLSVNPGPDISTAATAALAQLPQPDARRGLEALARAHLIEPGAEYGRWRMHDLLRLHSTRWGEADERERALAELQRYYLATTKSAVAHVSPRAKAPAGPGFGTREEALAWLTAEFANLAAASHAAGTSAMARDLPLAMETFLVWSRLFNDWAALATVALTAARALDDRAAEARALKNLGGALDRLRRYEESATATREALRLYRELGDRLGEATARYSLAGGPLQGLGRYDEAITEAREAVRISHEIGDHVGEAMALNCLAGTARVVRRYDEAVAAGEAAAEIYRELGDRYGEGEVLHNLGGALQETGRLEESIAAARRAREIYREVGDRHSEGQVVNNLGLALAESERWDEAVTAYRQAVEIHRDIGARDDEALALHHLGGATAVMGQAEEGIAMLRESLRTFREIGDRHREGDVLDNLGDILREAGRPEEAVGAHEAAIQIYRDEGDRHAEGGALISLGLALTELEQPDKALQPLQDAAGIYRELGYRKGESQAYAHLGVALAQMGRFGEAADAHLKDAEIKEELGDRAGKADAYHNFGLALTDLGDHGLAAQAHDAAAVIYRELGDRPAEATSLANLGNALYEGERVGAVEALENAARLHAELGDRPAEASALYDLGFALFAMARDDDAMNRFESAIKIYRELSDGEGEAAAVTGIGMALEQLKRTPEAIASYEEALRLYRAIGDREGEAKTLELLGDALAE